MLSVNLKSEMSSMLACSMLLQLMLFYILRTRSCVQVLRLDSEDAMTLSIVTLHGGIMRRNVCLCFPLRSGQAVPSIIKVESRFCGQRAR